jgi:hypothetical protein
MTDGGEACPFFGEFSSCYGRGIFKPKNGGFADQSGPFPYTFRRVVLASYNPIFQLISAFGATSNYSGRWNHHIENSLLECCRYDLRHNVNAHGEGPMCPLRSMCRLGGRGTPLIRNRKKCFDPSEDGNSLKLQTLRRSKSIG